MLIHFGEVSVFLNVLFWVSFFFVGKGAIFVGYQSAIESPGGWCAACAVLFQTSILFTSAYLIGCLLAVSDASVKRRVGMAIFSVFSCSLTYWNFLASGFCGG
jgi:hypothetical protein